MKKFLLLLAIVSLMVGNMFAQCPAGPCTFSADHFMNKVKICRYQEGDEFKYKFSETAVVGRTVIFEFTGMSMNGLLIDFQDGNGSSIITTSTRTVSYQSIGSKTISINYQGSIQGVAKKLLIKDPADLTKPYKKPDAIWDIKTTTTFNPSSAGAQSSFFSLPLNQQGVMNTTIGEGKAYIRFGKNHNNKIVRPIIYVDGIDFSTATDIVHDASISSGETDNANIIRFGATGWDVFSTGIEPSEPTPGEVEPFRNYPKHFQEMFDGDYDIVFLDFKEGATYMQKNAEVVIELLKQINGTSSQSALFPNRRKVASNEGTLYENIVVGASMGGQVAKYALSKMEYEERTQNGPSHCTKMYCSFDSQHKGAVVPLGVQSAAWYAAQTCLNDGLWSKLNQPASRQLLIEHLSNSVAKKEIDIRYTPTSDLPGSYSTDGLPLLTLAADLGVLRNKFLQDLQMFSPNGMGYPLTTGNIAIADGNSTGKKPMTFNKFDPLLDAHVLATSSGITFRGLHFRVNATDGIAPTPSACKTDFGCNPVNLRYKNETPFYFGAIFPNGSKCADKVPNKFYTGFVLKNPNFTTVKPSWDNAPGSYRNDLNTLHKILLDGANEVGGNLVDNTNNWQQRTCFSPTLSCLDVIGKSMFSDTDLNMDIDAAVKSGVSKTPFESFYAPHDLNNTTLQHVEIDQNIIDYINQQLIAYKEDLIIARNIANKTYNFGLIKKRIPSVIISDGGFLRVNNLSETAFLNEKKVAL